MVGKILFWIDTEFIHFGIANYLQEHTSHELYAIIDIQKPTKNFFQHQNFVKFKKCWFIDDEITYEMKKPDLNYLSDFEKKYEIDLWKLAFTERYFYEYNYFHKFTSDEILWILEQECRLFEKILDEINPDFFMVKFYTFHHIHILYELCKKKNIKILMMSATRFANKACIFSDFDRFEKLEKPNHVDNPDEIKQLQNYMSSGIKKRLNQDSNRWLYKPQITQQLKAALKFLFNTNLKNYNNSFPNYGKTRLKIIKNQFIMNRRAKSSITFLDKFALKKIPDHKFVYYPLHVAPERAVSLSAPFYTNQLEIIENIAKSIPIDFKLFVKENPFQSNKNGREISFYKKILDMPNVELIHHKASTHELLKKCSLVITLNGTTGFEVLFFGKPSIVLMDTIYSHLPSVYKLNNFNELPSLIRQLLNHQVNTDSLFAFKNSIDKNTFEFAWDELSLEISKKFFYGGFFGGTEILESAMKSFLISNKSKFEILVKEHLKKLE